MSSKKKVVEHLQKGLAMELAAINQYFLHALVAEDWGLDKLAARMREEMSGMPVASRPVPRRLARPS